jgi:RNA-directed DNA polymerase
MAEDTTTTAVDMTAAGVPETVVNGPAEPLDWDAIDWQSEEGKVRRLRQRIFKAAQAL